MLKFKNCKQVHKRVIKAVHLWRMCSSDRERCSLDRARLSSVQLWCVTEFGGFRPLGFKPCFVSSEFRGTGGRRRADRAGWMWAFVAAGLNIVWLDLVEIGGDVLGWSGWMMLWGHLGQTDGLCNLLHLTKCVFLCRSLAFLLILFCAYQRAPRLHVHLCGAVPDAVGNARRSLHGADRAFLPGLFARLHQLHCQPEFGKLLHP